MSVQLAVELWNLIKDSIPYDDRDQLADSFVGIMVDHGYDLEEIRDEFINDSEIIQAVKYYVSNENESYEENKYDDSYEDEDDDW